MKKLIVMLALVLCCLLLTPALASASRPTLKSLAKSLAALQTKVKGQATSIASLKSDLGSAKQTIATQGTALTTLSTQLTQARADITTLQNAPPSGVSQTVFDALAAQVTTAQGDIGTLQSVVGADSSHGLQKSVADLQTTVGSGSSGLVGFTAAMYTLLGTVNTKVNAAADVLALEPYVKVSSSAINGVTGPNIVFQGCNLQLKSTTGETDATGTGNLIVGWDDDPGWTPTGYRSGSNNLVCGIYNSFSCCGCFVAGHENTVSGYWSSVSGGDLNHASGQSSSVSGGFQNTASNYVASISGGANNKAQGQYSSISGGGYMNDTLALTVTNDYGWAAGNTAAVPTGTAKYSAP
jgi:hypothetical protein